MTHILDTDLDRLKDDQMQALKEQVCKVLDDVKRLFLDEKFQELSDKYIKTSVAGDGWGDENRFINFSWNDSEIYDVGDMVEIAAHLKNNMKIDFDL